MGIVEFRAITGYLGLAGDGLGLGFQIRGGPQHINQSLLFQIRLNSFLKIDLR
jgi:hypothetical protein